MAFGHRIQIRGVKKSLKDAQIVGFKNSTNFCVPLKLGAGSQSRVLVSVGDLIKQGTVIAAPSDEKSAFIYSPCSGAVVSIKSGINALGEHCQIVEIEPSLVDTKLVFKPLADFNKNNLFGRLVESGSIDTWGERWPSFYKYVNANAKAITTLIVKLFDSDSFVVNNEFIIKNYCKEVCLGASYFMKVSKANKLVFVLNKSNSNADKIKSAIEEEMLKTEVAMPQIEYRKINVEYPIDEDHLLTKLITKQEINVGCRVCEFGVAIENAQTCLNFYKAVYENEPTIGAYYTIAGDNFNKEMVCFVKNGTLPENIFAVAGIINKDKFCSYNICGALNGIAQCDKNAGLPLSVTSLTSFKTNPEQLDEIDCINCGKCNNVCPIKLSPMMLDNYAILHDYGRAKKYGATSCINCGLCSFVCPARRNLAQRINDCAYAIKEGRTL